MNVRSDYLVDVVVPCYQEEEALPQTAPLILAYMRGLVGRADLRLRGFRLLLVDDGSQDATWQIICDLAEHNCEVVGIKLSRNCGHQNALLAGLSRSTADACISMDADLQDDINVVEKMLKAFEAGAELALGVRDERRTDSRFKRSSANLYYRMLALFGVRIVENHADFRLMSRQAREALLQHEEVNLFLRGIIPTLGFKTAIVKYARQARTLGETKYTLRRMLGLALDGVTSFSVVPLRVISVIGAALFVLSMVVGFYYLVLVFLFPSRVVPGWASTVLPLLFLGGMQMLSIGVLGEYVGKVYMEVKRRPRFFVETETGWEREAAGALQPSRTLTSL